MPVTSCGTKVRTSQRALFVSANINLPRKTNIKLPNIG